MHEQFSPGLHQLPHLNTELEDGFSMDAPKTAVIDNIRNSEGPTGTRGVREIQTRMIKNIVPSTDLQQKTWIVISGITGETKSSTLGSLLDSSEELYQLTIGTTEPAPIYTWNVAWAIQAAEKVWGEEMQFGTIDEQKYEYVGEIQRRVRSMVQQYMPNNIAVLDEEVTETEALEFIDGEIKNIGPQRSNLADLKKHAASMDLSIIYVQTDEETRHANVLEKEALRNLGASPELKIAQESIGVVGDNRPLEKIHESYVKTGNQQMEQQHLDGVAFILKRLAQQKRLGNAAGISDINEQLAQQNIDAIRSNYTNEQLMDILHNQAQLEIARDIFGPEYVIPERTVTRVGIALNPGQEKTSFKRDENKTLVEERNILLALKKRAEEEKNRFIKADMIRDLAGVGVYLNQAA